MYKISQGWRILIAILFLAELAHADFMRSQGLIQNQQWHEASQSLQNLKDENLSEEDQGLKYFALGVVSGELQKWSEAEFYFNISLEKNKKMEAHNAFELAKIFLSKNELDKAQTLLEKVKSIGTNRNLQNESLMMLSEIQMKKSQWNSAFQNLVRLERRWRGEEEHPIVIWRLIEVEIERNRKWRACRWARKLYSTYPSQPIIYDWGIDLARNKVKGKALGCLASEYDVTSRMRRWHWAGEPDRARRELEELKKNMKGGPQFEIDDIMAKNLIHEGFAGEAVETLLPYYDKKHKDFDYLMSLASAAARSGEYQTAVGAYYKAHKLRPKDRKGREALFRAAFLSYQFQDYDGATRKFQELIQLYNKSGLSRDAQWHLAWIRYLKGDYKGAISSFSEIQELKKKNRRVWSKFPEEKIRYWLAMSYMKMEDYPSARTIFSELMQDGLMSFYSQSAAVRFSSLPVENSQATLMDSSTKKVARLPASAFSDKVENNNQEESEEEESEESLTDFEEVVTTGEEEAESTADNEEKPVSVKDPKLRENFERAQDFVRLGMFDRARWEYYEVERKTRNKDYLLLLMKAYEEINSYHRSAYIGQIFFTTPRERYEMDSVKFLWKHTYPLAYKEQVQKYSTEFAVPQEFIWSIMRAESLYRPFIVSPVGAQGLMQIMPNTGTQVSRLLGDNTFQVKKLKEPETNIKLGSRYLMRLLQKFEGSIPLAAAAYNAGPHRVESWISSFGNLEMDEFIEHIPFVETRNYVKKVTQYFGVYSKVYQKNTQSLKWLNQLVPVRMERKPAQRESWD
ncbi:MAG: transglycosylase SLT domain-containing protein [Bdellovibrionaceae bacterium]|nr:transglycosylase SLT domain-containing protein [Pseudobdellovibrionaceae bacterium]